MAATGGAEDGAARGAETTVRVRYAETDTMGVVYYGHYLTYFEVGRVEFLRQHGLPMAEVDRRLWMPVVEASVRYHRPARLDDLLRVRCWVAERRRASFLFRYEIHHAETGALIATGETRHACWHPETRRMIPIPDWLEPLLAVGSGAGEGGPRARARAAPGAGGGPGASAALDPGRRGPVPRPPSGS